MVSPSSATLVNSCGIPFIGFQSASVFFIGFLQLLGVAPVYLSELFVLSSSCPGRRSLRSASRGDYLIPRSYPATKQNRAFLILEQLIMEQRYLIPSSYTATKQNRAFSAAGPSLSGMAFHSNCALFHVIFRARFIVSLRPSFLPGPVLGALLSSYLEGALYKFHR